MSNLMFVRPIVSKELKQTDRIALYSMRLQNKNHKLTCIRFIEQFSRIVSLARHQLFVNEKIGGAACMNSN